MATLTAGWIETGITLDFTGSVILQVAAAGGEFGGEPLRVLGGGVFADSIYVGIEYGFPTTVCANGWYTANQVRLYTRKFSEALAARTVEATIAGACPQPYLAVTATRAVTGARLAANVDVDSGTGVSRLRYRLWLDELSTDVLTVGSKSVSVSHTGEFILAPTLSVIHESVPFLASPPADLANGIILAGAQWNGESDPTTFDAAIERAALFPAGGTTVWTYTTKPPMHYRADVDVRDAGNVPPPGSVTVGSLTVPNPGVQDATDWRWVETLGGYPVRGTLAGDWSADGVALDVGEENVPLRQIKPKTPGSAPENWVPTIYQIQSPLTVLLSGGSFTGTGSVAVSGIGGLTWTVSGAGTATYSLSGAYDPADGYVKTKHDVGDDVWGWGLFAYLEVDLTAPANGDLTLSLDWVEAGASPVTATKTYTLPVLSGTATYRVDLLFPNEGGPWYAERVSKVTVSGFVNGVYTLNNLQLVAVENAYVKAHARGTYSGLVISQDGSFAVAHWGDNPLIGSGPAREKDDESGLFDFGLGADTSAGGAVRMDGTLQDVADEWFKMEGILITYSSVTIDADLTDGTNVIGTEDELIATPLTYTARWYHTLMAQRTPPNVTDNLPASLYLDGGADLCAAPAGTFILPFRHVLGMVLEALAKDSVTGLRAGPGAEVFARRSLMGTPSPSDPLLASGVTDASGFASVAIRTGTVGGSQMYVALLGN